MLYDGEEKSGSKPSVFANIVYIIKYEKYFIF